MFNPNEEIQIIGVDLGDNPDMKSQYIINEEMTKLNKKLELKNRYKEQVKENIIEEQLAEALKYENIYKSRIDKAIEYIEKSMNNPQPFYEYLFGDENGEVENLDKLLNILQGSDKE